MGKQTPDERTNKYYFYREFGPFVSNGRDLDVVRSSDRNARDRNMPVLLRCRRSQTEDERKSETTGNVHELRTQKIPLRYSTINFAWTLLVRIVFNNNNNDDY